MKKISLLVLCLIVLFSVCGCNSDSGFSGSYSLDIEEEITQESRNKYDYFDEYHIVSKYHRGDLEIYDNGSCYLETSSGYKGDSNIPMTFFSSFSYSDCTYDTRDNEIIIKFKNQYDDDYNSSTCKKDGNNLSCSSIDGYSGTWKKK